jgi:hypothetical protein
MRIAFAVVLAFVLGGLLVGLAVYFSGSDSSSGTKGSGIPAREARDVAPFRGVELAGANNVVVHVGRPQSVVVTADDNLVGRVTTTVSDGTLVVANKPGSFSTTSPMRVEVTVPTLNALTLSGSGNIVADGVRSPQLQVSLPGSGTLTGSGTAARLGITVGGSGMVQFTRLVATRARATVSGSGSIFVTATGALDAAVSGSGAILYTGNPGAVTKNVTGSGTITGS